MISIEQRPPKPSPPILGHFLIFGGLDRLETEGSGLAMQLGKGAVEAPFLVSVHLVFDVFLATCHHQADQAGNPRAIAVIATGASLRATRARNMSPTTAWLLRAVMSEWGDRR